MSSNALMEAEASLDRSVLAEIVHWIKTLKQEGVSPDTAAQVASKFFIAACSNSAEECEEWSDEDDDEDDEE